MKLEENGRFISFTRTSHNRPMHLVTSIRKFGTHRLASHTQSLDESQTQIKHNTMKGVKTGTHGVFNMIGCSTSIIRHHGVNFPKGWSVIVK